MSAVYARCIRRFLYTLSRVEISVYAVYPDTCGRSCPYIFVYADVTVSEPVFLRMLCWLILWDVRIRIGYVWTQIFLYPHKKICGYKNLRIRVDGPLNGHFLFSFTDPDPKVCKDNTKTADCEDWKRAGFCTEHPAMIIHCKKTCGFCSSGNKTIFFAIIPAASKRRRNL